MTARLFLLANLLIIGYIVMSFTAYVTTFGEPGLWYFGATVFINIAAVASAWHESTTSNEPSCGKET